MSNTIKLRSCVGDNEGTGFQPVYNSDPFPPSPLSFALIKTPFIRFALSSVPSDFHLPWAKAGESLFVLHGLSSLPVTCLQCLLWWQPLLLQEPSPGVMDAAFLPRFSPFLRSGNGGAEEFGKPHHNPQAQALET